jgi:hypothetical protein
VVDRAPEVAGVGRPAEQELGERAPLLLAAPGGDGGLANVTAQEVAPVPLVKVGGNLAVTGVGAQIP